MMFVKVGEVRDRIKKYFHTYIDAGLKEIDVVDCAAELQSVIDSVPGVGWISVKDALPEEDKCVLVIVNGKHGNITFQNAIEMGTYFPDGWLLEAYTNIENPGVSYWMELPDGPEE